jgi:hypothetical protein
MLTGETTLPITVGAGGSYNGPQIGSLGGNSTVGFNSGTLTVFGGGGGGSYGAIIQGTFTGGGAGASSVGGNGDPTGPGEWEDQEYRLEELVARALEAMMKILASLYHSRSSNFQLHQVLQDHLLSS